MRSAYFRPRRAIPMARTAPTARLDSIGPRTSPPMRWRTGSPSAATRGRYARGTRRSKSPGESDHAGRGQRIDLATVDPQLAEDSRRVLTERRRWPSHTSVDLRAADGKSEHPDAATPGLLHLGDESEVLDLGVGEDLVELVNRAAGDRRLLESPRPLLRRRGGQPGLDPGTELVTMGDPRVVGGEAWVTGELGGAEGVAEALPLVGIHDHDVEEAVLRLERFGRRQVRIAIALASRARTTTREEVGDRIGQEPER